MTSQLSAQSLLSDTVDLSMADSIAQTKVKGKIRKDIGALAHYLTDSLATDVEKAWAIYRWMTVNLALYDDQKEQEERDLSFILKKKVGSSVEFAQLFEAMSDTAGLTVTMIFGYSKGVVNYEFGDRFLTITSAWNAIKLDSSWYIIDVARSTGYLRRKTLKKLQYEFKKEFDKSYFMADPTTYSMLNIPAIPRWQFLKCPVSMELFNGNPIKLAKFHINHNEKRHEPCIDFNKQIVEEDKNDFLIDPREAYQFNPDNVHILASAFNHSAYILINDYLPTWDGEKIKVTNTSELEDRKKINGILTEHLDSAVYYYKEYLQKEKNQLLEWERESKERKSKLNIEHKQISRDNDRHVSGANRSVEKIEQDNAKLEDEISEIAKEIEKGIKKESLSDVSSNNRENNSARDEMIKKNQERINVGIDSLKAYKYRMDSIEKVISSNYATINKNIQEILDNTKLKQEKLEIQANMERGETGLSHQMVHIYEIKEANAINDSLRKINIQLNIEINRSKGEFKRLFNMSQGKIKFAQNLSKTNKKLDYDGTKHDNFYKELVDQKVKIHERYIKFLKHLIEMNQIEINALKSESISLNRESEMHQEAIQMEEQEYELLYESRNTRYDEIEKETENIIDQNQEILKELNEESILLERALARKE